MSDLIIISLLLLISWVFGRCALHIVKAEKTLNELSIAIGISLVIIAVNFLYFIGDFRISSIRTALIICFIGSILYIAAKVWRGTKFCAVDLLSAFIMYVILVLPALIGGEQYYVFRGNWWDHFMYLSSAYGLSNYPLSSIINLDDTSILSNDLLIYAQSQYYLRPSVILLFSLFLSKGSGDIFLRAFLYNSAFLAAVYPPLKLIFRVIQNKMNAGMAPPWLLSLLPAGFIVGFWGQYIFDIQSWGQLASYSLVLAFVASIIMLFDSWHSSKGLDKSPPLSNYSVSIILFSGAWFIYPENALIHLVMLAVASSAWLLSIRPPAKWRAIAWIAALPLFSLLFALPNYQTTIGFIIPQTTNGVTIGKDWWRYFDSYLAGIDTDIESTVNALMLTINKTFSWQNFLSEFWSLPFLFIVSFFGFYFITPQGELSLFYYLWQLLVIAFALAIIVAFSSNLFLKYRKAALPELFIRFSCLTGLTLTAYLAIRYQQWWSAGKALSFTSPYVYILLVLPLVSLPDGSDRKLLRLLTRSIAWIVLILSLGFGVIRIYASIDENGIGYYRNYPSIQGKENKLDILWKLDVNEAQGCTGVNLDPVSHQFFLHYAKLKLAYAGIPYYTRQPVLTYLVTGDPIGTMPDIPTDCIISPYFEDKGKFAVTVRRMPRQ